MVMTQADKVANAKNMNIGLKQVPEVTANVNQLVQNNDEIVSTLQVVVPKSVVNDDAAASKLVMFYPYWEVGMALKKDSYFVDKETGDLYHVMQDGTAQAQYKPGMAGLESLFVKVNMRHGYRVYDPATVGYDYINEGDIVAFYNDWESVWEYYQSKINGNTVSPDAEDADRWWTYLGTEDELYGASND